MRSSFNMIYWLVLLAPRLSEAFRNVIPSKTRVSNYRALLQSTTDTIEAKDQTLTRELGSQELLMLPRQYKVNKDVKFPQMNHVTCAVIAGEIPTDKLKLAIQHAMDAHPLLSCQVKGDGEPDKRIDLFKMVRKGDPNPCTFHSKPNLFSPEQVLSVIEVSGDTRQDLDQSWQSAFAKYLDDGSWCDTEKGPLWKVELHQIKGTSALLFAFNHAISDQSSANRLIDLILEDVESNGKIQWQKQDIPLTMEESVMGKGKQWKDRGSEGVSFNTIKYVAGKALEGFKNPVILPDSKKNDEGNPLLAAISTIAGKAAGGEDNESEARRSTVQFRSLSRETTSALLNKCRQEGVSISNALTAAAAFTASDFVGKTAKARNYKVLQSLDMRRFGEKLDDGASFGCMAGSMDLMLGPISDESGAQFRQLRLATKENEFWKLARESKKQTENFISGKGPEEASRVFDFGMTISDMNNLVHLTASSEDTKGRAYSAGVTNAGVFERQFAFQKDRATKREVLKVNHGKLKLEGVYYATTHVRSGCLYPLSSMTIDGSLKLTFNPVSPIVSDVECAAFADSMVGLLEVAASGGEPNALVGLRENALTLTSAAVGSAAVLSYAPAYADFFQSILQMKENVPEAPDFWAALNFWIFFAVGHPVLQPALAISEVLHASPGPQLADLIPATFAAGNLLVILLVSLSRDVRNALNIAALSAFLAYVGAGLDGQGGLGDFNLALDDSYKGQIVKGCPAYDEVRQPSMNDFDLKKYQGLWYEHKFHDWTQFKEVYDTTLDIRLTDDGEGWIDDFAVKGPAPKAAPRSWDKSPVANGAHYYLFGRVDPNDPPGILREKGFGVEFPNYIVDVLKDPESGEYKEAIQFQCLERGGVRVFEGINFMSRNPVMSEEEMLAMHQRAEKAGMYPYGASPEQMHTVERRPIDAPPIDNNWQAFWRAIGLDKLLELLTESIEDGSR